MSRILFINPGAQIGGAERSLLELITALPRDTFEVRLLVPRPGPLVDAARAAGASVDVLAWPRALETLGREPSLMNRLLVPLAPLMLLPVGVRTARYMKHHAIDLVHTNGTKAHLVGAVATMLTRRPLVWHLRDVLGPGLLSALLRFLGRLLPVRIIANSKASAASFDPRPPGGKLVVIYNGLDLNEFHPVPRDQGLAKSLSLAEGDFVITTLGALSPLKGHIHLIRAMPEILAAAPNARLLIVGDEMYVTRGHSGYRQTLESEAERLGLKDRVIFAGRRGEVAGICALSDIVVLCSIRPESFGRVLAEAMACGRPVIGTDLGGPREIIPSPEYGLLVPPADPAALARAILALFSDPRRRMDIAAAGSRRAIEQYSIARHVAEVSAVYNDLLAHARPAVQPGLGRAAR